MPSRSRWSRLVPSPDGRDIDADGPKFGRPRRPNDFESVRTEPCSEETGTRSLRRDTVTVTNRPPEGRRRMVREWVFLRSREGRDGPLERADGRFGPRPFRPRKFRGVPRPDGRDSDAVGPNFGRAPGTEGFESLDERPRSLKVEARAMRGHGRSGADRPRGRRTKTGSPG